MNNTQLRENIRQYILLGLPVAFATLLLLLGRIHQDPLARLQIMGLPINPIITALCIPFLPWRQLSRFIKIILPLVVLLAIVLMIHPSETGLWQAIDLIVVSFIASSLFARSYYRDPSRTITILQLGLVSILFAAIYFKFPNAIFDREVKFWMLGPNVFARLMLIGAVIGFVDKRHSLLWGLFNFLFIIGVVWSGSRGTQIALIVCLIGIAVMRPSQRKRTIASLAVTIALLGALFLFNRDQNIRWKAGLAGDADYVGTYETAQAALDEQLKTLPECLEKPPCVNVDRPQHGYVNTMQSRTLAWKTSWYALQTFPVAAYGVGLSQWPNYFKVYDFEHAHNFFLGALVELGLVGGILLIGYFFLFLGFPKEDFFFLALGLMICQQVSGNLLDARYWLFFLILILYRQRPNTAE